MSRSSVDEWDLVIKVKHGDTLRRISAYVNGQFIDHDINKLKAKIISLFNFSDDAELIITYTDEDGDVVTLDDDDELHDAILGQRLNPLRINVQLKPRMISSTKSPQLDTPVGAQFTVNELPKSIPEPVLNALSELFKVAQRAVSSSATLAPIDEVINSESFKSAITNLSNDVMKAASTSPTYGQIMNVFSKLALSNTRQPAPVRVSSDGSGGASTHLMDMNITYEPKDSNYPSHVTLSSENLVNPGANQSVCNNTQGTGDMAFPSPVNTEVPLSPVNTEVSPSVYSGKGPADKSSDFKSEVGTHLEGKSAATVGNVFPMPFVATQVFHGQPSYGINDMNGGSTSNQPHGKSIAVAENAVPVPCASVQLDPGQFADSISDTIGGSTSKRPPRVNQVSLVPQYGLNSNIEPRHISPVDQQLPAFPFSSLLPPNFPPPPVSSNPSWSQSLYFPRSHSFGENAFWVFHKGVQCDGCGMHPIVGPRFKSNVMEDYDLCNTCFTQTGNKSEYTKIERSPLRAPKVLKDFHKHHLRYRTPSFKVLHRPGVRPRTKLESCFIKDVTVLDGTMMPPSTHFTKIWRMRNNGAVAWPLGTQLLWVGGDKFGDRESTTLEITARGFPVDHELDVAVDFTAPSRPGRYVSYWKMASPSGHKFGQRVWVLIQVDYSRPNSADGGNSFNTNINLNLPPESSNRSGVDIVDVNSEPLGSEIPITHLQRTVEELVNKPVVVDVPNSLLDVTIDDPLKSTPDSASNQVSSPLFDLPVSASVEKVTAVGNMVEELLLKDLDEMGFKQIDLNKEILRLNEYDLQQSVDDLCGFAEWDPLLAELYELGFNDRDLNKKVLIKNSGSIKRAVLDLIAGEKGE